MKRNKAGLIVALDSKFTGEEIVWENYAKTLIPEKHRDLRSKSLSFYTYYCKAKDLSLFLYEWALANGYNKKDIARLKNCKQFNTTAGKLARAMTMGMPSSLGDEFDDEKYVRAEIASILLHTAPVVAAPATDEKTSDKTAKRVSPMVLLDANVNKAVVYYLDELIDKWVENKKTGNNFETLSLTKLLKGMPCPLKGVKIVQYWFDRNLGERIEAYEKTCDQMVEGYSYLSRSELRNQIKILTHLEDELQKFSRGLIAAKPIKVRTKKVKTPIELTSRIEINSSSAVSPSAVVGKDVVATLNVKNNVFSVYVAADRRDGLSFKGKTLIGFDPAKSFAYRVGPRNKLPEAVLNKLSSIKTVDTLKPEKGKTFTPKGRFNSDLKIIKTI